MNWVKLLTGYYRDIAIAVGDDAMEVMFTRGLAYCGDVESGGFIPEVIIASLTRRPGQAKKIADRLVTAGPWEKATENKVKGYRVKNWHAHQRELELLVEKRQKDALRKRMKRAEEHGQSHGTSTDSPTDVRGVDIDEDKDVDAAAAASGGGGIDLPVDVQIFADLIHSFTPLRALSFDIEARKIAELQELIATHGDKRLFEIAKQTCRTPPPVLASAFIRTWQAMPPPGKTVHAVEEPRCHDCHQPRSICTTAKAYNDHEFQEAS